MRKIHLLLAENQFFPLLASSGLAVGLFAGRVWLSHSRWYSFLVWNLILAWLPFVWSLWALSIHRRQPRRWWMLLPPGALWLLFFPNAPYLITDFLHLRARAPVPLWYDIGLLMAFAWAGCFLALTSLGMMHQIIIAYAGRRGSWLFIGVIMGLCGLGIYMGRFLRWNSWDLLLFPSDVLHDVGQRLIHPFSNLQTYGVTLMFAAFLFVCYWTFVSIKQRA